MKVAIYPGTFDPITNGHLDIIQRSCKFVDKLIIEVSDNKQKKNSLFEINERIKMIKEVVHDENLKNIEVDSFNELLMNYASKKKADVVIRGLRAISDFEYEFQMTGMNYQLNPDIETIFLMSSDKNSFISSNLVKEVHKLGGNVSKFVSNNTIKILNNKNSSL